MTKEMNADDFMQEFDESVDDVMKKYRQEINNIYEAESKEVDVALNKHNRIRVCILCAFGLLALLSLVLMFI